MKIRYEAKTAGAEALFRKYVDVPAKEIKKIEIMTEKPFVVHVTPKFKGVHRVMINRAKKKVMHRPQIEAGMMQNYVAAMRSEGLKPEEYDIRVIW